MPSTRRGLELLARLGYAARGAVNLIVGVFALLAAFGRGSGATGSRGAILTLLSQPQGGVLLAIVALGLFGFAIWRALQSILDADGLGSAPKAIAIRAGQAVSAAVHVSLGIFAVNLAVGWSHGGGSEEQSARDWTRWLLAQPLGQWLVGLVGLAILATAFGLAYKAWTASFTKRLACDSAIARWVVPLGRAGYAARALVFLIVGTFLVVAAYQSDPSEALGLTGALLAVQEQEFGWLLFGIVALGLAAFGAFGLVEAQYRRIDASAGSRMVQAIGGDDAGAASLKPATRR